MGSRFLHSPRRRKKPQPSKQQNTIGVAQNILRGIENDLREVREGIHSTEHAMRQASRNRLGPHWQKMPETMRNTERDLLIMKGSWERFAITDMGTPARTQVTNLRS